MPWNGISRSIRPNNENPEVLSQEQITAFNDNGYVRPVDIFSAEEVVDLRNYFDALLEKYIAEGGDSLFDQLGPSPTWSCVGFASSPQNCRQRERYSGRQYYRLGFALFLQDASRRQNKSPGIKTPVIGRSPLPKRSRFGWPSMMPTRKTPNMRFISGSHKFGHMTYRPSGSHEDNVLNQTIENVEQYGNAVDNPLQAGQISIHSDLLLHGSNANESERRRCALTLRFAAADVRAGLDWNQKGVWVAGEDATGHWANRERPDAE